jgi:hypothetical protein
MFKVRQSSLETVEPVENMLWEPFDWAHWGPNVVASRVPFQDAAAEGLFHLLEPVGGAA